MRPRAGLRAALLLGLLALAQPAAAEECPFPEQRPKLVVQLFFSGASPAAWARFLAEATRQLPDGFTVYDAYGQWMDPATHRISHERTRVIMVADADSAEFRARVAALAATYKRRFHQQSVGVLTNAGCGAF